MKIFCTIILIISKFLVVLAAEDWTNKSPLSKPSARDRHAMAYIGNGKVVLYGGLTASGKNAETWVYDLNGDMWTQMNPSPNPGIRCDHAMAYLGGDQVLMFGGSDINYSYTSSCWIYDLSENSWTELYPGTRPSSRRYHAMAYIGDGKVLMVGGQLEGTSFTGETWLYETSSGNWTSKTAMGFGFFFHSLAFIGNDNVLLAGIRTDNGLTNEAYLFDLSENTWTQKANLPESRANGAMVYIGGLQTMFFGGYDAGFWTKNTTYIYNLSNNTWTTDINSSAPTERIEHSMAETSLDGTSYIVLFGGDASGRNDETWSFGGGDYTLPVELSMFTAEHKMQNVELRWRTKTEVNNYGFEVERKIIETLNPGVVNMKEWQKVGFVHGSGTNNSPKEYSFTDKSPLAGGYAYRLKQIDNNGMFKYSHSVEIEIAVPIEILLHQNFPNPFNPSTTISFNLPTEAFVSLKVYDNLGCEVSNLVAETLSAGLHSREWNGKTLPSGIYFYNLRTGSFNETRKLVLLR